MVRAQLDFGCGGPRKSELSPDRLRYQCWLLENGGDGTYGIDIDPEKIADMQGAAPPGTKVIMADGHDTHFDDKFFDYVHVAGVLHHMNDHKKGLKEIARITKPGGKLYLFETIDNDPIFRLGRRIIGNWRGDDIKCCFMSGDLITDVLDYFCINKVKFYWRFYLSDLLLYFHKEPGISLRFNSWVNRLLAERGLDKYWASHIVIEAERKAYG